jgi:large subunit ribosomal protein L4
VPIRRDLIYRLMHWARFRDLVKTKTTLTKGTVSGAGKKPRPQKKTGLPRIGNKRAPGRWKGGKAHGPKPTIYTFHLNEKVKLKAICSLLTSKLAEGRIRIITDFSVETAKTKVIGDYSFGKECQ